MERLLNALEKRQKVTQRALDYLNQVLEEIREAYDGRRVIIGELIFNDYIDCGRGMGYRRDVFIGKDSYGCEARYEIVSDVEDLGKGGYYGGNYYCWYDNIDKKHILYIMKNLRRWVEEKAKDEENYIAELENILEKNFK